MLIDILQQDISNGNVLLYKIVYDGCKTFDSKGNMISLEEVVMRIKLGCGKGILQGNL